MPEATAKSTERPGEPSKLREGGTDAPDPALAAVESFKPLTRPPLRITAGVLAAGAVVAAVLAVLGYRAYEMLSYSDIPIAKVRVSPAASGEVRARETAGSDSSAGRIAAAIDAPAVKPDGGAAFPGAAALPTEAAPMAAARVPSAAPRANAQTAAARKAVVREAPRAEPCTEAIAAIGLCTLRPGQAMAARAAPAVDGKTAPRAQPGAGPCTEALTVLGLCTPESNVTKE